MNQVAMVIPSVGPWGRCPRCRQARAEGGVGRRDHLSVHHQFLPPGASQAYGEGMDHRTEVSEFLRSRRNRITPEQAGIVGGGRPRVPGLRREEVAMLAGVSVEYYARMQRGELAGVSAEVLDSVAQALQLDEAEIDQDRKSTRLNSSHVAISYAVFCLKKKNDICTSLLQFYYDTPGR